MKYDNDFFLLSVFSPNNENNDQQDFNGLMTGFFIIFPVPSTCIRRKF
jgi:hypothetical protein